MDRIRRPTSTSTFGVGRRESHDASRYYDRALVTARVSADETIATAPQVDQLWCHTSERMRELPDNSVALVVTSPSYHVGKDYDTNETLDAYLKLLRRVFKECHRVLEPGGRIAINVANLGRKPYVPLADLVVAMMGKLGYHFRGEIIWIKGEGMAGNCAWGSFAKPSNPVLRDLHEYILVFSAGRFDRALAPKVRKELGLPHVATITKADFMAWTLSVWHMAPASARRVGHPAPFPVELPRRLIELYTYEGDLVLDPFMGAGSTAVAAVETGRLYAGYDLDAAYLARAEERIALARAARSESA